MIGSSLSLLWRHQILVLGPFNKLRPKDRVANHPCLPRAKGFPGTLDFRWENQVSPRQTRIVGSPFWGKLLLKIPSGKRQVALTELIADSPFSV